MEDSLILEKEKIRKPEKEIPVSTELEKKLNMNIDHIANNRELDKKVVVNAVAHAGLTNENLDEFIEEYRPNGSE